MFARTARLTLRPGWPEDAPALFRAIAHEQVAMRAARLPWPYAMDDAAAWLSLPRGPSEPRFLILRHGPDRTDLIGGIGLTDVDGWRELGYWLTPAAWGQGYATEAGRAVLHMARYALPARPVRAFHQLANPASGRVLEKLGLRQVGQTDRYCLAQDRMVPCAVLELPSCEEDRGRVGMAA